MVAPFCLVLVTAILSFFSAPEQRGTREGLGSAASVVDLGAVLYAAVAVQVEQGVRLMFWALDERRKWR